MTMFNPQGNNLREPEDWAIEAMQSSRNGNLQYISILGVIGAIAIVPFAGIPAGLFGFACFAAYTMSQANKSQQYQAAIQEFGCVANALEGMQFKAFRAQVGDEEVLRQLRFARAQGLPIKKEGQEFLYSLQPSDCETSHPFADTSTTIIPATITYEPAMTQVSTIPKEKIPDIAKDIAVRLKPTLIVGVPGAGKDCLCWNAVEYIKQSKAKVKVYCIDPKGDRNERPYFEGRVDKLYSLDFNSAEPEKCYELLQTALKEYEEDNFEGTKLLIFNELNATTKTLKRVKGGLGWLEGKLTFYSSSGRSRGWVIWAISQTAHEKGLGFGGETRPIFIKIVLITLANPDAAVDILRAQIIAAEQKLPPQELKKICDRSPVGVAVYHGSLQKWFPQVKMRDFLSEAKSKVAA